MVASIAASLACTSSFWAPQSLVHAVFSGAWFEIICLGAFTKGLGLRALWPAIVVLLALGGGQLGLACLLLKKQEP
jgi:hypothetical protein